MRHPLPYLRQVAYALTFAGALSLRLARNRLHVVSFDGYESNPRMSWSDV
jgi:hypothetical protein